MKKPISVFLVLKADDDHGLVQERDIAQLVIDLGEDATSKRELGYDQKGRLVHRWPCENLPSEARLFDLTMFDRSKEHELSEREFDDMWNDRTGSAAFFTGTG